VAGWTGILNDPALDGSHDVRRGLREARQLLVSLATLGVPAACEWVSPVVPSYLADAVAWSAIGARTTESQVHRHLASSLPMPAGFKNATDGDVQVAADACLAAAAGHTFLGITPVGTIGLVSSSSNPDCHVVLRGGRNGPNFDRLSVARALTVIEGAGLPRRVVIDASHGNSGKDHRRQPEVARSVARRWPRASAPSRASCWKASWSPAGRSQVTWRAWCTARASPTPAWTSPQALLEDLAGAVRQRRQGGCR
jgi:3-deoxy-7-phosphoheptulonate synthase